MARTIEAYKLRTELAVDATKGSAALKGFQKDVDGVGKSFEKLGPTVERSTRKMADSFKSLKTTTGAGTPGGFLPGLGNISEIIQGIPQIGRLAGALTRPLMDAAEAGIQLNMTLETAAIGFEGVAGSAEKAGKHIKNLQDFGKKSPFRFEGLLEASQLMTAFGFTLDEQIPKLRIWGNAIAASGDFSADKVSSVVRAFGQMRMAGRVTAEDMNQLTTAKIPGWELLAKSIGKSVAQTRKLAEAGKLNGAVAEQAITKMMAIDPRYKDMMQRMEGTLAGRLSTAQDIQAEAQGVATQGMTKSLSAMLGMALKKESLPADLAKSINTAITPVGTLIESAASTMLGGGLTAGFIDGVKLGQDAVKKTMVDLGLGAVQTIKDVLGMNSPSTVFIEIGMNAAQSFFLGFAAGVQDPGEVEKQLDEWVQKYAELYQVPVNLARGIMKQETGHLKGGARLRARSPKDARGPMQLMAPTATRFGVNRMDPEQNVEGGIKYLRFLLDEFAGDLKKVIAAYNAGEGAVKRYGAAPPGKGYAETRAYVPRVEGFIAQMGGLGAGGVGPGPLADLMPGRAAQVFAGGGGQRITGSQMTADQRRAIVALELTIQETTKQIAETGRQLSGARKELDQAPLGSNRQGRATTLVNSLEERNKKLVESLDQLNQQHTQLIASTIALNEAQQSAAQQLAANKLAALNPVLPVAKSIGEILGDLGTVTLPQIPVAADAVANSFHFTGDALLEFQMSILPAAANLHVLTAATEENAEASLEVTKEMQAATLKSMLAAEETSRRMNTLSGAMSQAAGMVPSSGGEVGKKRGLFSKILGIAAPFLNFIPGVGPILATIAGGVSAGLAGNWGGALSAAAGGFASGGAFNPVRSGSSGASAGAMGSGAVSGAGAGVLAALGKRAGGGPVRAGQSYLVGERGQELFTPGATGVISPAGAAPVRVEVVNWPGSMGGDGGGGGGWKAFATGGLFGVLANKANKRARGGPVYRGQRYLVGEQGSEIFAPTENGFVYPHGAGGGGAGDAGAIVAAAQELRAAVAHLNSMPASHVVMKGARGMVRAMDRDAGLIRLVGQRQRLA